MHNPDTALIKNKIHLAARVPEPSPEFANRLWAQIVEVDHQKSTNPSERRSSLLGIPLACRSLYLRRRQAAIGLALAVLLAAILIIATPEGRAWAQSLWRFFTPYVSDTKPAPTEAPLQWVEQTRAVPAPTATELPGPTFSAECGNLSDPKCSVDQIRGKVKFPVKELAVIPTPMVFIGATGGPDQIEILYDTLDHRGGLALNEQPWSGDAWQTNREIGASAVVEKVMIGNATGEYVKGSFNYRSGETQQHWDPNIDMQTLRWVDNGIFIQLENFGMPLERDELIRLAAGLTSEPVSAKVATVSETATPSKETYDLHKNFPLTVLEAEKQAGFKVKSPSSLPSFLSLIGASFDEEQHLVQIFYPRTQDNWPSMDGLLLAEQIIPSTKIYRLSKMIVGEKTEIEKYPPGVIVGAIENVRIWGAQGQYAQGVWHGTDCCGWVWEADTYLKRLRWQEDGIAYELIYTGMDVTKEDLIEIATGLK